MSQTSPCVLGSFIAQTTPNHPPLLPHGSSFLTGFLLPRFHLHRLFYTLVRSFENEKQLCHPKALSWLLFIFTIKLNLLFITQKIPFQSGPQNNSISIPWKLIRNSESQALAQTSWISVHFNQIPDDLHAQLSLKSVTQEGLACTISLCLDFVTSSPSILSLGHWFYCCFSNHQVYPPQDLYRNSVFLQRFPLRSFMLHFSVHMLPTQRGLHWLFFFFQQYIHPDLLSPPYAEAVIITWNYVIYLVICFLSSPSSTENKHSEVKDLVYMQQFLIRNRRLIFVYSINEYINEWDCDWTLVTVVNKTAEGCSPNGNTLAVDKNKQ